VFWRGVHQPQQDVSPALASRSACIGGQGTEPYEQKTQQSPGFGPIGLVASFDYVAVRLTAHGLAGTARQLRHVLVEGQRGEL
jgi:hypothetical protein